MGIRTYSELRGHELYIRPVPLDVAPASTQCGARQRQGLPVGYGSGRASCVTRTGQSDLAKTACVVDVHWRGGPIRRMSTFDVSATLTISVAGTPGLTTTSMSHHDFASGGIAANNWARISDEDGLGSVITHTHVTCPCVSHASESACLMTLTEDGAKPTAHRICLNTPALNRSICRPVGTIRTGQSERATTVAVTEPIGRVGRSAPAAPMTTISAGTDFANFRIWVPGSPCLTAAPVMGILRIGSDERLPQLLHNVAALERTQTFWNHEASCDDNVKRPQLRASRARDSVRPLQRVHGQRRQIHRAENVT